MKRKDRLRRFYRRTLPKCAFFPKTRAKQKRMANFLIGGLLFIFLLYPISYAGELALEYTMFIHNESSVLTGWDNMTVFADKYPSQEHFFALIYGGLFWFAVLGIFAGYVLHSVLDNVPKVRWKKRRLTKSKSL